MPAISNLAITKNDNTTAVTFTAQQPSSGDSTAAIWQNTAVGSAPSHRPELRLVGRSSKDLAKRNLRSTFVYPQIATNTTTGLTSVVNRGFAATDWSFARDMSTADLNEFVSQYAKLIASPAFIAAIQSGFAPS